MTGVLSGFRPWHGAPFSSGLEVVEDCAHLTDARTIGVASVTVYEPDLVEIHSDSPVAAVLVVNDVLMSG